MRPLLRFAVATICACSSSASSGSAEEARALRDQILEVNAHVVLMKAQRTFAEYRDVLRTVEDTEGVAAAAPFLFLELDIGSEHHLIPYEFALKGVDPQRVARVVNLDKHLKVGTLRDLARGEPPSIILGDVLAETLAVRVGDSVVVSTPGTTPTTVPPRRVYPFLVTGIIHTQFDAYNQRLALASLAVTQQIANRGDQVMGIEVKVKDVDRSDKVARAIERAVGGAPYEVKDWYELNSELLHGRRP